MSKLLLLNNNEQKITNLNYKVFTTDDTLYNNIDDSFKVLPRIDKSLVDYKSAIGSIDKTYNIDLKKGDKIYYKYSGAGFQTRKCAYYMNLSINGNEIASMITNSVYPSTIHYKEGYYEIEEDLNSIRFYFSIRKYNMSTENGFRFYLNELWINYDNYLASIK